MNTVEGGPGPPTKVSVVGAGLMGHGIAQVFAEHGYDVTIHDTCPATLERAPNRIADNLVALHRDPACARRIRLEADLDTAVADATIVFEAVPEQLPLKQRLFARMGAVAPDAVLATNTSVLSIGAILAETPDPARALGAHWWNPPYLMPLVEVIEAPTTSEETVATVTRLLSAVGRTPVRVRRDIPGFIGNRLQHALIRQAFELVDQGVCDAETIDTVVRLGFGRRLAALGPMENADLVGLDLTLAVHEYLLPTLDPPSAPAAALRRRVDAGDLGMKSGRGFRAWTPEAATAVHRRLLAHLAALADRPADAVRVTAPGTEPEPRLPSPAQAPDHRPAERSSS